MTTAFSHLLGREVDSASEEHRHECECRWLLANKPTRSEKHLYLYGVYDRAKLMAHDPKTGQMVLAEDYRQRQITPRPLMNVRSLEAADRILADARRIFEAGKAS